MISHSLINYSTELMQQGLHRKRLLTCCDNSVINFSSNDYLSLTQDLRIKNAFQKGFSIYPAGSGGSMVICGYHPIHKELENALFLTHNCAISAREAT